MAFVTRLAAAVAGTRVAGAANKYGLVGTAAGVLVTTAILRWPGKALLIGAAYGANKLWAKQKNETVMLEDHSVPKTDTPPMRAAEAML